MHVKAERPPPLRAVGSTSIACVGFYRALQLALCSIQFPVLGKMNFHPLQESLIVCTNPEITLHESKASGCNTCFTHADHQLPHLTGQLLNYAHKLLPGDTNSA